MLLERTFDKTKATNYLVAFVGPVFGFEPKILLYQSSVLTNFYYTGRNKNPSDFNAEGFLFIP